MTTNIYTLLSEYKLGEAINSLESKVENLRDESIIGQFHILSGNYRAYLRALTQQISSIPKSDTELFYRQAYAINDRANRRIRLFKAPNDQYSLAINSTDNIFNRIWTSDMWDDTEKSNIESYTESFPEQFPLIVSAVTLSVCEMFDERKVMFLFDAYEKDDTVASLRALIGLIIILRRYDSRFVHYPQIEARLSILAENPAFVRQFFSAHVILQYSKMTDSVSDKMRNDIIPTLINSARFKKTEFGMEEIDQALSGNGENPDWIKNITDDDKVEKKIHQMTKLQTEGADIYMTTFRHLKSFPFFSTMQNWFEPFSYNHPQLQDYKRSPIIDSILSLTPFSDSDKYSFVFMLNQMGDTGSKVMTDQFEQQLPEDMSINDLIDDAKHDRDSIVNGNKAENIMRRYSQDLYRFYTLYPYRSQFFNPFDSKLSAFTPLHRTSFTSLLSFHEELLTLAEFFMRKGVYADALEIFQLVKSELPDDEKADIFQKMGFCKQKMGNFAEAFEDLLEADDLQPGSHWTTLHLFQTSFELKRYDDAVNYLDLLIDENPDDLKLLTKKAECLFALDRFQEAIPLLYKVVYLDDESLLGHQMLAWALLMTDSYEKSTKEYLRCVASDDHSAYIYLGHLEVLRNNITQACEYYRQALNQYCAKSPNQQSGHEQFHKAFWHPVPYIKAIDRNTLSLLLDHTILC